MGDVIYVDFSQKKNGDMWELHQPINETDYMMAIRCPDENYHELIARRVEKLNHIIQEGLKFAKKYTQEWYANRFIEEVEEYLK